MTAYAELFITFDNAPTSIDAVEINDELASILSAKGYDPSRFNRLLWPAGASRYASMSVIVRQENWLGVLPSSQALTLGTAVPVRLTIGRGPAALVIEDMFLLTPRMMVPAEFDGLMEVELVDVRWFWQTAFYSGYGLNVRAADKLQTYAQTIVEDYQTAVELVIADIASQTPTVPADFETINPAGVPDHAWMDAYEGINDITVEGHTAPVVLDRLLMSCGTVLVAKTHPVAGDKFLFQRVDLGHSFVAGTVASLQSELVAGMMHGTPDAPNPRLPVPGASQSAPAGVSPSVHGEAP